MADYSHLALRVAASPEIYPRELRVFYRLEGEPDFNAPNSFVLPLLLDGAPHDYSYDLKLLELGQTVRLTGLRLALVGGTETTSTNQLRIEDFRLIRGAAGGCAT